MNKEEFSGYMVRHGYYEDENFGDVEVIIIDDVKNIFKGDKE